MSVPRPIALIILDGFGERAEIADNAVRLAKTPNLDAWHRDYASTLIGTSGPDVGLPPGQMGNSEVGHLNFGAGRIAVMELTRIDLAVSDGSLAQNKVIREAIDFAKIRGGKLHLMGLVSDGGVHSSIEHLLALIDAAKAASVPVAVHAFLDGRDTAPGTALGFLAKVDDHLQKIHAGHIATVSGRYFAMDRDNRWERVEKTYRAIVEGAGPRAASARDGVEASFAKSIADEFVEPFVVGDYSGVGPADAGFHFNFRPDRARELTRALAVVEFEHFARKSSPPFHSFSCMTTYDATFPFPVAYPKPSFANTFGEVLALRGLTQFRCAETEKYAHVTYFFNGGREQPFPGEDRRMISSPRDVATYDLKPAMSAREVTSAVDLAIQSDAFDFILVNYANPDMIGHTGILPAAIEAVEVVDEGLGILVKSILAKGGAVIITADHGNCEMMRDPITHNPHTSHTLNPVPLLYIGEGHRTLRAGGRICDVAPTMLELMGIPQPPEMTGVSLFNKA